MSDLPAKIEEDEEYVVSGLSPRNEHDGKIVTSSHPSENSIADDASDLTDHNADDEDSTPKSFPQKLMNILGNEEYTSIIAWLPAGNGFQILKKKAFASEILPRHFKATQFTSFTRKLNRWGFSRAPRGPECGAYFHKLFHRDHPELSLGMSSGSGTTKSRTILAHDTHPPPIMSGSSGPFPGMPGTGMPPYFLHPANNNMMMPMNPMQQQQQAMWHAQYYMQQQMQMMAFQQQAAAAAAAAAAGVPPQAPMMPNMMMGPWQAPPPHQQQQQQQPLTAQLTSSDPPINHADPASGEESALFQDEVKDDLSDDVGSEARVASSGSERDDGDEELNAAFDHVEQTEGV